MIETRVLLDGLVVIMVTYDENPQQLLSRYETIWMQEVAAGHRGGSLDIEARWMQEAVEGHREGSLDLETTWAQEVAERLGGKYR